MKAVILFPEQMDTWIQSLASSYQVYGPVSVDEKPAVTIWSKIDRWNKLFLADGPPTSSPKHFFFPQPETLFTFSAKWSDPEAFKLKEPQALQLPTILAGVRPCDSRSVMLNSLPYKKDPYFQAKMEAISIIGLTCTHQCSTCFCRWVGGSPLSTDCMDIALYPLKNDSGYVAEPLTQKGKRLLEHVNEARPLNDTEVQFLKKLKENEETEKTKIPEARSRLKEKELMLLYEAPFWQNVAETCINCGACTFLCPTCYCFDIQDETTHGKGRRIRYWDSCMFPLFTLHASGHNPRGKKIQRVRNRFMHKLKYFPDRFGPISCVGCGRCIKECPVNIDIREVIREMLGAS